MNAEFYTSSPRAESLASPMARMGKHRRIHRWLATIFTLTVAANFVAMLWGQPPAVITYAPLPPLLFLMVTGLTMLVSSWIATARSMSSTKGSGNQ
jgi:peptidoglycan/LPS O-acetylase OafA/YrhL